MSSLSASEPAVRVEHLSVRYRTTFEKAPTLKSTLVRLGRRERGVVDVQALQDVSFAVPHGSVTGVIGANGAGKTTLMRALAGIIPPNEGRIEIRGRVTTMLALGIGMNPSLSGRENIVLGCLAAGMEPARIEELTPDIEAFADIGEFIDYPVKTYSSGMRGRLAFAVAINVDPDILLIDEALSAGDASFKDKAQDRMMQIVQDASSILLVSHGLATIQKLADHAIWLHKGKLLASGHPDEVVDRYTEFVNVAKQSALTLEDV